MDWIAAIVVALLTCIPFEMWSVNLNLPPSWALTIVGLIDFLASLLTSPNQVLSINQLSYIFNQEVHSVSPPDFGVIAHYTMLRIALHKCHPYKCVHILSCWSP
jgi:hypothetical protein